MIVTSDASETAVGSNLAAIEAETASQSVAGPDLVAIEAKLDALSRQVAALARSTTEIRQLVGPFGLTMPNGTVLVQTLHQVKYLIDPRDMVMAPQLIVYRQWEPELSRLFSALLTPDTVFVDVGANFGYFTCLAGSRIGTSGKGRIFAVEPNPALVKLLTMNAKINWSMCPIQIFPVAVAAEEGVAELFIPVAGAANASLSESSDTGETTRVSVDLKPLDSIVPPGTRVDLLKVDVEGHETGVLLGARRVLAESPDIVIVLEWSLGQTKEAGYDAAKLIDFFDETGLSVFDAPADGRPSDWPPLTREQLLATPYANILLKRA
jgi:FkbM family methyltransferase